MGPGFELVPEAGIGSGAGTCTGAGGRAARAMLGRRTLRLGDLLGRTGGRGARVMLDKSTIRVGKTSLVDGRSCGLVVLIMCGGLLKVNQCSSYLLILQ